MTYSPEAQSLIDAITSGDCCDECSAPNDQRHFDLCSKHPENDIPKAVAAVVDASLDYLADCIGIPTMPRVARELDELRAKVERLRSYKSLPEGMVWQDYYSPDDVCKIREPLDNEIDDLKRALAKSEDALANALLKISELEGDLHDRDELAADLQAGIEARRGL